MPLCENIQLKIKSIDACLRVAINNIYKIPKRCIVITPATDIKIILKKSGFPLRIVPAKNIAGKNANISYKNYAEMGIAVNAVNEYASKNLTEKQAAVVNKAMQDYNDALVKLEKDTLARAGAVQVTGTETSEYYGMGQPISKEVLDSVRSSMGVTNGKLTAGIISATNSATNKELIGKIRDAFSNTDITDQASVDEQMEKYKKLVTPAYMAYGNYSSSNLTSILNGDISGFQNQIKNLMYAVRYHKTDFRV